jgi:hypothetical protein
VVYAASKPEMFEGCCYSFKQELANQYSRLAESKSLVIKSCSEEKVHFQVVKFCEFIRVRSITHVQCLNQSHLKRVI